jgi:trigger factor
VKAEKAQSTALKPLKKGKRMELQKEVKKEANAKISIQVTVDKQSVGEAHESVIKDFEQRAKLPGFRQGKVPRSLILSRFQDSIKSETINKVLTRSLSEALKDTDYRIITEPSITEMGDLVPDENFSFTAECDIMPELDLADYRDVSSEKYIYDVKDDTVKEELERLQEQFANLVSVDRKAAIGDYVVIDYVEEGDENKPQEKKENQTILLDKKDDPFAKQLVGLGKGDSKDIELEQEYEEEGEKKLYKAKVHVDVHEVKQKELPELSDDFAKDISDVESLVELKKAIEEDLNEQAARRSEERSKNELMQKIISKTTFDIPETLVNYEIDRILSDVAYSYRIDMEQLQKDEQRYREYRENLRPRALETVKYELTLGEVAKKEDIAISDEEIDKEIRDYATRQKKDFNEMKKRMTENESIENLRYRLRIAKALDFVYEHAKLDEEKHIKFGAEENA